jgi:integrase
LGTLKGAIIMATIRQRSNLSWQVIVRRTGFPKQHKVFKKKQDAILWARQIEHEIDQGNRVDFKRAEQVTIKDIVNHYLTQEATQLNRSYKREQSRMRLINEFFGDYVIAQITPARIALFRDTRLSEGLSPATVIKDINTLSKVLKMAQIGWGVYLANNPILSVNKPKVVGHRVRRLSSKEENILIQNTTFNMQAVIIFAIETGMRLGEILSLQWTQIQNDMAVLNQTKNNEIRYVPFTKKVIHLLQTLPKSIDDKRVFFFWKTVSGFESSWQKFKRKEELVDLRFHDLRHEAISRLFEKGLNHMEVSAISGHKSLHILRKYTHFNYIFLKRKKIFSL